jgi:hypothetical protein
MGNCCGSKPVRDDNTPPSRPVYQPMQHADNAPPTGPVHYPTQYADVDPRPLLPGPDQRKANRSSGSSSSKPLPPLPARPVLRRSEQGSSSSDRGAYSRISDQPSIQQASPASPLTPPAPSVPSSIYSQESVVHHQAPPPDKKPYQWTRPQGRGRYDLSDSLSEKEAQPREPKTYPPSLERKRPAPTSGSSYERQKTAEVNRRDAFSPRRERQSSYQEGPPAPYAPRPAGQIQSWPDVSQHVQPYTSPRSRWASSG